MTRSVYLSVSIFCLGIIVGMLLLHVWQARDYRIAQQDRVHLDEGSVLLTNPYLECVGEIARDEILDKFQDKARSYVREQQQSDQSLEVSWYLRDLVSGAWVGNQETRLYDIASFSKVPTMMYILSEAEHDPDILKQKILFDETMMQIENNLAEYPELQMTDGASYSVGDLLYRTIAYSDNYAFRVLLGYFDMDQVESFMQQSGFVYQTDSDGNLYIDAKTYSSLFRMLYNASFLSREASEYALLMLSENVVHDGFMEHLGQDILVSSKFAVHQSFERGSQYHQCGIIYFPDQPHLLCVMTASYNKEPEMLSPIVGDIAGILYELQGMYR